MKWAELLMVACACATVDYLLVRWQQAVADRRAWRAAGFSAAIRLASSLAVVVLVADHWAIAAATLGDAAGTWLAVRYRARTGPAGSH